ncbi:SseB family protein [Flavobacterium suncheonense]|uniref:SseB family protein n=1 Tax=Flavobacterium suncheonense TaxID=350894 RepID=UPI003FA35FA0
MNLLKKLFGKKEEKNVPDNTRLLQLIRQYHSANTQENYKLVLEELYSGNAYLVVPTYKEATESKATKEWGTLKAGRTLNFTSVFNVDGLMVFGVFTSEEAMAKWIKEESGYTAMPAKVVLDIAQEQQFGRVVIDSDQDTMFVLERDTSNITSSIVEKETKVMVGTPERPIAGAHKESLIRAFKKNSNISEVYHFIMDREGELVLILAVLLEKHSENAQQALYGSINEGMQGYELELPLEIMYLQPGDSWYDTARNFELFYQK